jgi:hypothetical protein
MNTRAKQVILLATVALALPPPPKGYQPRSRRRHARDLRALMGSACSAATVAPEPREADAGNTKAQRRSSDGRGPRMKDHPIDGLSEERLLRRVEEMSSGDITADLDSTERDHASIMLLGAHAVGKTALCRTVQQNFGQTDTQTHRAEATALAAHLFYLLREVVKGMGRLGIAFSDPAVGARATEMIRLQVGMHTPPLLFVALQPMAKPSLARPLPCASTLIRPREPLVVSRSRPPDA